MAAVKVRKAVTDAIAKARALPHPHVTLSTSTDVVVLDYVSPSSDLGGLAPSYDEVARPGRRPLLLRSGQPLPRLAFSATLANGNDRQQHVEADVATLKRIAGSGEAVLVSHYGASSSGAWRLTDLTIKGTTRTAGTNHISRAELDLGFTAVSDPSVGVGPLTGGARPAAGSPVTAPGKGNPTSRPAAVTYVVKGGDTLAGIASRFYRNPDRWRLIADANGIRDPRKLRVGQRLTIPPAAKR